MSKKEKNPLFSGEAAFQEEQAVAQTVVTDDILAMSKPMPKDEPHQYSLYSKSRKGHFNFDKLSPQLKKMYLEDCQFVKGRFLNHECPGGNLEFHAGPWDETQTHVMQDGATYTVRKYIADHINKNCRLTKYSDAPVEIAPGQKKYVPLLTGGTQRFNFIIESFV